MNKTITFIVILAAFLLHSCAGDMNRHSPYCIVDYTVDGIRYHDETTKMYLLYNPKDKVSGIQIESSDTSFTFRWEVFYPFTTEFEIVSDTPYFEEGKKYHPAFRYGYDDHDQLTVKIWKGVRMRNPIINDGEGLDLYGDESWFSFYNYPDDVEVGFVMNFELALKNNLDTLFVRDGKYLIYKKMLLHKEIPII